MEADQPARALAALTAFLDTPLDAILARHQHDDPAQGVLALFQTMAAGVPAYGQFLAEQGLDAASIRSASDLERVPPISKRNYVQHYPLAARCREGKLEHCDMLAVSSGSTGTPTIWPRFVSDELAIARRFEQVFHDSFEADQRRTLAVVCFALGTWVGGMYTTNCCRHLASKGYPITLVTPGNNRAEILRVVQELGPAFDQVVLLGYPPALKDVIDHGLAAGLDWPRFKIKLVLAGEVFSEEWRSLVGERTGMTRPCYDSAALYGTADAGVLANETPLSICVRRFLAGQPEAARQLFGEARLPTLAQYDPWSRFFEATEGGLLFSGDNGVPLVRYNILDRGGIIGYQAMLAFLAEWGFDPLAALRAEGERGARDLPFVYVFGRSDFTISYFGANIYPENISIGLEQPTVSAWVTGKFVMEAREDAERNRALAIVVELAPGLAASDERREAIAASILGQLLRLNSEFAAYVPADARQPQVTLKTSGDPEWFPVGVKHRYTR